MHSARQKAIQQLQSTTSTESSTKCSSSSQSNSANRLVIHFQYTLGFTHAQRGIRYDILLHSSRYELRTSTGFIACFFYWCRYFTASVTLFVVAVTASDVRPRFNVSTRTRTGEAFSHVLGPSQFGLPVSGTLCWFSLLYDVKSFRRMTSEEGVATVTLKIDYFTQSKYR